MATNKDSLLHPEKFALDRINMALTLLDYGKFYVAAIVLGANKGKVQKGIAALEEQLGFLLFERTNKRRVKVTVQGKEFLERMRPIVLEFEKVLRDYSAPEVEPCLAQAA